MKKAALPCLLVLASTIADAQTGYDVRSQVLNSITSAVCDKIGEDGRSFVQLRNKGISQEKLKMNLSQLAEQHPDQINSDRLNLEFTIVDVIYARRIKSEDGGYLAGKQLCLQYDSE